MTPDAAFGTAGIWVAGLAAAYLLLAGCRRALVDRPQLRRVVGLSLVLVIAGSGVALAAPAGHHPHHGAVSADWPGAGRRPHQPAVVVAPGDCLWDIAGRRLRRATAADIATAWPRWWQRNRGVIGADPDVIHPGQRLRPPVSRRSS